MSQREQRGGVTGWRGGEGGPNVVWLEVWISGGARGGRRVLRLYSVSL